ncbi:MAG: hypothetical protein ACYS8W_08220 [Planctomycetota bacterium]|jgi:hypothetical protein
MDRKAIFTAAVLLAVFFAGVFAGKAVFTPAAAAGPAVNAKPTNVIFTDSADGSKLYAWDLRDRPEVTIYFDTGKAVKTRLKISEMLPGPR